MKIQVHTLNGIIELDSIINTDEDFVLYGLTKCSCQVGETPIKTYIQNTEPILEEDNRIVIWINTSDNNRVYLVFRRGNLDNVAIELGGGAK